MPIRVFFCWFTNCSKKEIELSRPHDATRLRNTMSPSILIVEDDPFTSSMLEFIFQRAQFDVTLLSDGQTASDHLEMQLPADIVLLDIMLPHVSGMSLLTKLRERAATAHTPVIMLSAKDQVADIQKAFACGADDYVVKPFDPDELLARVQRFLKKSHDRHHS